MSSTPVPFAVVDNDDHLMGIIVRGAVLGALSGNKVRVFMHDIPALPLAQWIDSLVNWLTAFKVMFYAITNILGAIIAAFQWVFDLIPAPLFIAVVLATSWWIMRRSHRYGLIIFELIGLALVWNLGYWQGMTQTLTLVLTSSLIAVIFGIPLGIWAAKGKKAVLVIRPLMDFMQTIPAFVYLIPAIAFFGIGMVPGVVASVIFAMPPHSTNDEP